MDKGTYTYYESKRALGGLYLEMDQVHLVPDVFDTQRLRGAVVVDNFTNKLAKAKRFEFIMQVNSDRVTSATLKLFTDESSATLMKEVVWEKCTYSRL